MNLSRKQAEVLARIGAVRPGHQPLAVGWGSGIRMATARELEKAGLIQIVVEKQRDHRPHARTRGQYLPVHVLVITKAGRAVLAEQQTRQARIRFTRTKLARLNATPIQTHVVKYEVKHPQYGTWELWWAPERKNWVWMATRPTSAGVPPGKIFSADKIFHRTVKPNSPMERLLLTKAEQVLDKVVAEYDFDADPHISPSLRRRAMTRSQKENSIAANFPPDSKKGRGQNRTVMLTGDVAKVLGRKSYDTVKLSGLSDSDLNKLYAKVTGKKGAQGPITLRQALQRVAAANPKTRPILVPLLRRHANCGCGDEMLAMDGDELMGGRQFSPHKPSTNKDYAKNVKDPGKWLGENKGKCYYETGDEADRCYVTTQGGPGGQTKPDSGSSKNRSEYNKKYIKQRWPDGPDRSKYAARGSGRPSGLDSDQEVLWDELYLMAENDGRAYQANKPDMAVKNAFLEYQKIRSSNLRADWRFIRKAMVTALAADWAKTKSARRLAAGGWTEVTVGGKKYRWRKNDLFKKNSETQAALDIEYIPRADLGWKKVKNLGIRTKVFEKALG